MKFLKKLGRSSKITKILNVDFSMKKDNQDFC